MPGPEFMTVGAMTWAYRGEKELPAWKQHRMRWYKPLGLGLGLVLATASLCAIPETTWAMGRLPSSAASSIAVAMKNNIQVEVGESPQEFVKRYGKLVEVNDKNYGLAFYAINWSTKNRGHLTVKNGPSTVSFDTVLSVSTTFDSDYPSEGFSGIWIAMGLAQDSAIAHDEARKQFYALMQRIQEAGWKRFLYVSDPRLSGEDAFRYQIKESDTNYSLDPSHVPALSDWMRLKDRSKWLFYLNGVYMDVALEGSESP